jgi:hypothetical protein
MENGTGYCCLRWCLFFVGGVVVKQWLKCLWPIDAISPWLLMVARVWEHD